MWAAPEGLYKSERKLKHKWRDLGSEREIWFPLGSERGSDVITIICWHGSSEDLFLSVDVQVVWDENVTQARSNCQKDFKVFWLTVSYLKQWHSANENDVEMDKCDFQELLQKQSCSSEDKSAFDLIPQKNTTERQYSCASPKCVHCIRMESIYFIEIEIYAYTAYRIFNKKCVNW